jgi:hypothetical protein
MKKLIFVLFLILVFNSTVFTQIPTDSLVGYWSFSGNANDKSGNNNHGTVNGATLTKDRFGIPNSAYIFDGIDDYITLPQDFDYSERTISLWFNAVNIPEWNYDIDPDNSFRIIYTSDHPNIENGMTKMWVTKIGGVSKFCFHNGGADVALDNSYTINEMEWYFAAVTVTSTNINYYLNGELLKTRDFPGNIHSTMDNGFYNSAVGVGRLLNHRFYDGKIDDIRIYNRELNELEISNLYYGVKCVETIYDTTYMTIQDTITTEIMDTIFVTVYNIIAVTDTLIIDAVLTDINPPDNINTLKIYPNPAKDHIFINTGDYTRMNGYQLKIINQLGSTVFETNIEEPLYEVNLSTWTSIGLYYVQVIDSRGIIIDIRKIILQ